jgi:hypothetical protein
LRTGRNTDEVNTPDQRHVSAATGGHTRGKCVGELVRQQHLVIAEGAFHPQFGCQRVASAHADRGLGGISVADADDVRRLALALPHVAEIESDGFDFRVAGKGFVWSYPERAPGKPRLIRTDIAVLFVGDEAEKQALLLGEPDVFFTTPSYDGLSLVMLRLAEVKVERLRELVTDAWRMRAPDALVSDLDEAGESSNADPG